MIPHGAGGDEASNEEVLLDEDEKGGKQRKQAARSRVVLKLIVTASSVLLLIAAAALSQQDSLQHHQLSTTTTSSSAETILASSNRSKQPSTTATTTKSASSTTDSCCAVQCKLPKDKCCLHCDDQATTGEHEVIMALMEGLTFHIEKLHKNSSNNNKHKWLETRAWKGMSHIGNRDRQATFYFDWARAVMKTNNSSKQQICEIGFNGGHSAAIFLAAAPSREARLTVFDYATFSYSSTALDYVEHLYPHRIDLVKGNSLEIVPAFAKEHGRVCDIFSVDGDHRKAGAKADIMNAVRATRVGGWIILDDVFNDLGPRIALDEILAAPDYAGTLSEKMCVQVDDDVSYLDRYDTTNTRAMKNEFCWLEVLK